MANDQGMNKKYREMIRDLTLNQVSYSREAVKKQLFEMRSQISKSGTQAMMWYFGKQFRKGIQSLFVDMEGINTVKRLA